MPQISPSYVKRDYDGLVSELTSVIQRTRPDLLSDFSQSSLGALMRDLLAYVGDNANYAIDSASLESFLSTCRRLDSGRMHAKSLGYILRPASAAYCELTPDSLPPEVTQYGGTIKAGSQIRVSKTVSFEAVEDIVIPINALSIRITLTEGTTYDETLPVVIGASPVYTVSRTNVAADSWHVYVGGSEWVEVEDVTREVGATNTYSVDFDAAGRLQVQFGSGSAGAIPTEAVRVKYRTCAGASGNVPAKGVRGPLPVTYTPSGGSPTTVSVVFENYAVITSEVGEVSEILNEQVASSGATTVHTLALANYPVQQGTLSLTVPGPTTGSVVLSDNGSGVMVVVSNTTGDVTFVSGTLVPSSGAVTLTYGAGAYPTPGSTYSGNYYYFPPASARTVQTLGAAVGGVDRETLAELKRNVPTYMRTSNRMVAYQDYREGLLRVPGVALAHVERFRDAPSGNVANVYTWGLEQATLISRSTDGTSASAPYNRYAVIDTNLARNVQVGIRNRALLTVQHIIQQPAMVWIDAYLGQVSYDSSYSAQEVRENIVKSAIRYFQSAGGFELRMSKFTSAILSAPGVRYASLPRLAIGYGSRDASVESVGETVASATQTGSLSRLDVPSSDYILSPGSVTIYFAQGSSIITLIDDAEGNLVKSTGTPSVVSGTINYFARTFTVTFSTALSATEKITASFNDVAEDLRLNQTVTINSVDDGDNWPPAGSSQSEPVAAPPFFDGLPLTKNGSAFSGTASDGDVLTYAPLRDILLAPVFLGGAFYDDSYYYNDGILYTSSGTATDVVRAVNLRNLTFDLVTA